MWLAIGKFFSAVLKLVLGIFTGILNWVREHPREACIVAVSVLLLVASNWETFKYATKKAHEKDAQTIATLQDSLSKANAEVDKANKETKERDDKIKRIEDDSKTAADTAEQELKTAKGNAKAIVEEYEKKLELERKKYKVVYVKDPSTGKDISVTVDNQGQVRCNRFSDTFMEQTNKLVDNANAPLVKKQGDAK